MEFCALLKAADESSEPDVSEGCYGSYGLMQSGEKIDRELINVKEINLSRTDDKIWVRGRLHTSRAKGMCALFFQY